MIKANGQPISGITSGKPSKRAYESFREFFADIFFLTKNIRQVRRIGRGNLVPRASRERLNLAVISVYGCRYCSWIHTREGLRSGIEEEEIAGLLTGSVDNCPQDEAIALLYAQHWADSDTKPDPEAVRRLEQTYGTEKAEAINVALRMVRVGNLSGNSWDRFLHRISLGRWGK